MLNEVTNEMKRQTRDQASYLAQQVREMERMLADVKEGLNAIPEFGGAAMRGVTFRGIPEHMARIAAQMSKTTQTLTVIADLTDAANAGTCEEVGV